MEISPQPAVGRVFETTRLAGPGDVGAGGELHLDALARWIQDTAFSDLIDADPADDGAWLVRKTAIRIEVRPRYREQLRLQTWCSASAASIAERRTSIRGDAGAVAEAVATWVFVDLGARRPRRLGQSFERIYGPSCAGRRARGKLRHPPPSPGASRDAWTFTEADVDLAGHINNTIYWRVAETKLTLPASAFEIEAEHREELQPCDAEVLRTGSMLWIGNGRSTACSFALSRG